LRIIVSRGDSSRTVVNYIGLVDIKGVSLPSLGQLVERFGEPCGVNLAGDAHLVEAQILYPAMVVNVASSVDGHLQLNTVVGAIDFSLPDAQGDTTCHFWKGRGILRIVPWLGFVAIDRYRSAAPIY